MSLSNGALSLIDKLKDSVQDFAYVNSTLVYTVGALAVVAGTIALIAIRQSKNPGEGKMNRGEYILSRREQRQQEQNAIADALADGLLTAFTKGHINEDTYKRVHLRLGTSFGFKDMLPVKLTQAQLKDAIKKRRGHKSYRPIPFPKETPKPKNTLDAVLSKFKS